MFDVDKAGLGCGALILVAGGLMLAAIYYGNYGSAFEWFVALMVLLAIGRATFFGSKY